LQGIKTLDIRWSRVSETACTLANYLESKNEVAKVLYPLLASHPDFEISKKQFSKGVGGVVSFELRENSAKELSLVKEFVEALTKSGVIIYGESLASPQSLLAYPAWMSHRALPQIERDRLGISDRFFRFSVGFEDVEDIIDSFELAFSVLPKNV